MDVLDFVASAPGALLKSVRRSVSQIQQQSVPPCIIPNLPHTSFGNFPQLCGAE